MTHRSSENPGRLQQWWTSLMQILHTPVSDLGRPGDNHSAKDDAKNRLKLVLMHDRTNLSPTLLESMRDELMGVIAKYVEIDEKALELYLEQESNTIALVANISVVRRDDTNKEVSQPSG
jgi:cell division topological specificity factor